MLEIFGAIFVFLIGLIACFVVPIVVCLWLEDSPASAMVGILGGCVLSAAYTVACTASLLIG